jgi:hypothetical protein
MLRSLETIPNNVLYELVTEIQQAVEEHEKDQNAWCAKKPLDCALTTPPFSAQHKMPSMVTHPVIANTDAMITASCAKSHVLNSWTKRASKIVMTSFTARFCRLW